MKVNFERQLKNLDGKILIDEGTPQEVDGIPVKDENGSFVLEYKPVILSGICINALLSVNQQANVSGEEKLKRYQLAIKVKNGKGEVSAEEISLIKKLVGEVFSPLVVGQVWEMLEE